MTDVLAAVRTYIVEELSEGDLDPARLDDQTNLIEEDILDSLGIMSLVEFLEERYGLDIDPAEIEIENFETLAAISSLVAAKQAARAANDA